MSIYHVHQSLFPFAVNLVSTIEGIPDLLQTIPIPQLSELGYTQSPKNTFDQLSGYLANLSDGELSGVRMAILSVMTKGSIKHIACFKAHAEVMFTHDNTSYAMIIAPLAMQPIVSLEEVDDAFSKDPKNWGKVVNTVDDPSTRIPF